MEDYHRETSTSPSLLKQLISKQPYTAGIALCPALKQYKGGIFEDEECGGVGINHSVVIVGYGREGEVEYWIVENSMGVEWGEDGFGRIRMLTEDVEGSKVRMATGGYARLLEAPKYAPVLSYGKGESDCETPTLTIEDQSYFLRAELRIPLPTNKCHVKYSVHSDIPDVVTYTGWNSLIIKSTNMTHLGNHTISVATGNSTLTTFVVSINDRCEPPFHNVTTH